MTMRYSDNQIIGFLRKPTKLHSASRICSPDAAHIVCAQKTDTAKPRAMHAAEGRFHATLSGATSLRCPHLEGNPLSTAHIETLRVSATRRRLPNPCMQCGGFQRHRCKHALFIPIATRLRHAAVIARLAHLIRDETPAFQITRRRAAIPISQSRLLYRDMGAGAKRRHRNN